MNGKGMGMEGFAMNLKPFGLEKRCFNATWPALQPVRIKCRIEGTLKSHTSTEDTNAESGRNENEKLK